MHIFENIQLALEGIRANKLRSLLTMLGIIIGVSAVIGIITVGTAITQVITDEMHGMGARNIQVSLRPTDADALSGFIGTQTTPGAGDLFTPAMINEMHQAYYLYIDAVSLSHHLGIGWANSAAVSLFAVNPSYAVSNNLNIMYGRFLNDADESDALHNVVISDKLAQELFYSTYAIGQQLNVLVGDINLSLTIIGVYEHRETLPLPDFIAAGRNQANIYIPLANATSAVPSFLSGVMGHGSFVVTSSYGVDNQELALSLVRFLNTHYADNPRFETVASPMSMVLDITETLMNTVRIAVTVIAGISLIVGGVGVMNIMLVSVTERTREIGVRRALGAKTSAIRLQFITEAIILCSIGGIIGVFVGICVGFFGGWLLGVPSFPSFLTCVLAVVFSMGIGLFFGFYPANKAAKLDPIEALRHE